MRTLLLLLLARAGAWRSATSSARLRAPARAATSSSDVARPRVLLFDVLDTLVVDPFFQGLHRDVFGFETMQEFFDAKDNQAYLDFESGACTEAECFERYFKDGRAVDVAGVRSYMRRGYRFVPGAELLLAELKQQPSIEMHLLSNYGPWWQLIEEKLALSRYAPWSFVSCQTGVRKPDTAAFTTALERLGADASEAVFVDDSQTNCDAAEALGIRAVRATGDVAAMRAELVELFPVLVEEPSPKRTQSTCRVCRQSFVLNGPTACRSHPGALRGESARKGDWESGRPGDDLVLSWTCCGGPSDAPGCEVTWHATYDDA